MKKNLLFAAIMLFATTSIFAQSEQTVVIKEKGDGNERITVVEKIFHNEMLYDALPNLYYSYLDMRTSAFGPEANVPLRSSSFEWGLYNSTPVFITKGGHFGMSTGFGISNSYNFFTQDQVLRLDEERKAFFQSLNVYSSEEDHGPVNNFAHRSFLRYWSLRVPLMFQYQWKIQSTNTPMAIAAGAEFEWRFGVRSFARYGGAKHTITDNLDYNPIGFNALVSLVFDDSVIFFRMGLTDMFTVKDSSDIYQMAIGFGCKID